ncbi:MAG: DUF2156 domain-containing protein [Promethearchaeota archaeon]|nr:MAG: DUF2156 domain-containing protein [Candidatus Lokiarchaeota archaeon]
MDLSNAKPIEINDKPLFDSYFKKFPPEISEFTFTNLFIWRKHYDFLFTEFKEHLIIFSTNFFKKVKPSFLNDPETIFFLPPVGNTPSEIVIELFKSFELMEVHRVPDNITQNIRELIIKSDLNIEIVEDRNNWDYVYEKEAIMNLTGNKHRQNRRWLNKFLESYNYEFNLLSEDWVDKCRELQLKWCLQRGCHEDESLLEEQKAINEALDNFNELDYKGAIICVENECAAYTFGEMLNSDTLVVHIEKAHMQYEGSYQAINNLFLKNCCEDAQFVNREQDLGISGLRTAKESYKPHHMVKKSIIFQKKPI